MPLADTFSTCSEIIFQREIVLVPDSRGDERSSLYDGAIWTYHISSYCDLHFNLEEDVIIGIKSDLYDNNSEWNNWIFFSSYSSSMFIMSNNNSVNGDEGDDANI